MKSALKTSALAILFSLVLAVFMVPLVSAQQAQAAPSYTQLQEFTVTDTSPLKKIYYEPGSNGKYTLHIVTDWEKMIKKNGTSLDKYKTCMFVGDTSVDGKSGTRLFRKDVEIGTDAEIWCKVDAEDSGVGPGDKFVLSLGLSRKTNDTLNLSAGYWDNWTSGKNGGKGLTAPALNNAVDSDSPSPVLENLDGSNAGVAVRKIDTAYIKYVFIRVDADGNCRRVAWDDPQTINLQGKPSSAYYYVDEFGYDGLMFNRDYVYYSVEKKLVKGNDAVKLFGDSQTLDSYFDSVENAGSCVALSDISTNFSIIHASKETKIHTDSAFPRVLGNISYESVDYDKVQLLLQLNSTNILSDSEGRWSNGIFVSVNGGKELFYDGWRSNTQRYNVTVSPNKTSTVKIGLGYTVKKANGKSEKPEYKDLGTITVKPKMLGKGSVTATKLSSNMVSLRASKNINDNYTNVYCTLQVKNGSKWKDIKSKFGNKNSKTFYTYKAKGAAKKQYRVVMYFKGKDGKWYTGPASGAVKAKKNEWNPGYGVNPTKGRYATSSWYPSKVYYDSKGKLIVKGTVGNSRILTLKKVKITVTIRCQGKKVGKQSITVKNIKGYGTKSTTIKFKKAKKNFDLRNGGCSYVLSIKPTW